jgi:hypothetical protein
MKSFLMRKMLASKMKGVPQAEQDKIFDMIEKNPDFFQKIGLEIQSEMNKGVDQMTATQNIVKKY